VFLFGLPEGGKMILRLTIDFNYAFTCKSKIKTTSEIRKKKPDMVAHTYNPTYFGSSDQKDHALLQSRQKKKFTRPHHSRKSWVWWHKIGRSQFRLARPKNSK
jgi:hypothetical protein